MKKFIGISIAAALLLVLASLSSVVGTITLTTEKEPISSPLFTVRKNQMTQPTAKTQLTTSYLGKEHSLNLFISKRTILNRYIDYAIKVLNNRPQLINEIMQKIESTPEIQSLLVEHDITTEEIKGEMERLKNHPDQLASELEDMIINLPLDNDPMPLGLSTSNPLGCFILIIAVLPVFIVIGMMLATMTIITCLNLGGCFENLIQNMIDSFIQNVSPPDA